MQRIFRELGLLDSQEGALLYHIRRERAISRRPIAIHRGLFPLDPKWLIKIAVRTGPISPGNNNVLLHPGRQGRNTSYVNIKMHT